MIHIQNDKRLTHQRCRLVELLLSLPPGLRGSRLHSAVSFRTDASLDGSFEVGPLRAAFADQWESRFGEPVPIKALRQSLDPPVPIGTVLEFNKLAFARDYAEMECLVAGCLGILRARAAAFQGGIQKLLFEEKKSQKPLPKKSLVPAESVSSLTKLLKKGRKFPTIYADPPWPYDKGVLEDLFGVFAASDAGGDEVKEAAMVYQ